MNMIPLQVANTAAFFGFPYCPLSLNSGKALLDNGETREEGMLTASFGISLISLVQHPELLPESPSP